MGNKPHHTGSIGGGINLSKSKTPHDADIKYMPVDDRAASPLHQGEKLKKRISKLSDKHKNLKDAYDMGQKVNEKKLFRVEDKLERKSRRYEKQYGETAFDSPASLVSSTTPKKSIKKQIGKAARAVESKAPGIVQKYFNALRKKQ